MTSIYPPFNNRLFYGLTAVGILLNITGLFSPIMELDGALYACIAKAMAQSGDFINLYAVGVDWLDKPHFPFWIAAISFKIFGINTFAYKFPALLFFLASVAYTYHFVRLSYDKLTAQISALVLLTAFHGILSNNDVRAEPYLMPLIIGPVYHFYRLFLGGRFHHLLIGSLLTACALMTKGVFVLIPIGAGLIVHWLLTGQWREFFHWRWYVAIALSFVFTLPEIYCLYQQFDLHPEKLIFGKTNVSGIRFFFWDSQFGRFFNTGPIKGSGDKFFFLHTLLWAFLPWSLPLYMSIGKTLFELTKGKRNAPEYVSLGTGLATFLLFSLSGFQLPHYINIVFPFYAILTAHFLLSLKPTVLRRWTMGQTVIGILIIVLTVGLLQLVRPDRYVSSVSWIAVISFATYSIFRENNLASLMGRMVGSMLILASTLNVVLYPTFLHYQAGMTAADYVNEQPTLAHRPTILYEPGTGVGGGSFWSYEFYAGAPTYYARTDSTLQHRLQNGAQNVFTTSEQADSLMKRGYEVRHMATFPYYHVSRLTYNFLNPATRAQTLESYVLAAVSLKK